MKLRNKGHKIKKTFCHVLQGHQNQYTHDSGGLKANRCQPTTDLLNSADFGCSEENELGWVLDLGPVGVGPALHGHGGLARAMGAGVSVLLVVLRDEGF